MRTLFIYIFIVLVALTLTNCDEVTSSNPTNTPTTGGDPNAWLIPSDQVFDGGPGKDGIPALENPQLVGLADITYVVDDDLVIALKFGDEVRVYPHSILDWHEIINDGIGSTKYALTYCPLTGSGIGWDRVVDGRETTFGVSGLLYNTNLIAYDRATGSNWAQMRLQSVNGSLISTFIDLVPLIETKFSTIKTAFPNSKIVSTNTGYSRRYGNYPYGNYRTNHSSFVFPVEHKDDRLKAKERVLGIIDDVSKKAYLISSFSIDGEILIDKFRNKTFLVYGNSDNNFITAFDISAISDTINFSISTSNLPWIFEDNLGNKYDLFGSSENKIIQLKPAKSFISYWFAWAAFYQNTRLYRK